MSKVIKIKLKKERVVLSDILPYETPITFSNRFFYDFLIENEVYFDGEILRWKKGGPEVDAVIFLVFGIDKNNRGSIKIKGLYKEFQGHKLAITIPFHYGISHKENSFRMLSVMHPRNQVQAINFYDKYKEIILYFSQISSFSLRAPFGVAKTKFFDDERKTGSVIIGGNLGKDDDKRYKNLKSFFSYRDISNIHQFFESRIYHSCEQKYNNMAQLDISKCFDSIYTHSVAWAAFGKSTIKNKIATDGNSCIDASFPGDFDRLMQRQNYNETNGILIGPELSRIFSEIILQRIDFNIEANLRSRGILNGREYQAFRYVDDYFIFFNDETDYKIISEETEACLNEYKLGLNTNKEVIYHKPIITEITIAKRKISELLSEKIAIEVSEDGEDEDGNPVYGGKININSKPLITKYKSILSESGAGYKDVINYTLSIVERKVSEIFNKYKKVKKGDSLYRSFLKSIHSVVEFCFFIYAAAPRVNTTIKLSRVLKTIIDFSKTDNVSRDDMHQVFKRISDDVAFIISKYGSGSYTQVETLYLLAVMSEMGKNYWIEESVLVKYFGGRYKTSGAVCFEGDLNYFSITVLIFYIKNKKRYERLKKGLEGLIISKFKENADSLYKNTECVLLALDCICCPYLDVAFKKKLLRKYEIGGLATQEAVINYKKNWFTKWSDFEFGKELDAKQSEAVY